MLLTSITNLMNLSRPHLFLLDKCRSMKDLIKFHGHFTTTGLSNDTLFLSSLVSFTALSPAGDLRYAHLVFNHITSPNTFMYNTMIRAYVVNNPLQALLIYTRMFRSAVSLNNYTFPFIIKASSRIADHRYGENVHATVIKYGYIVDLHIANSLLHMYATFGFSRETVKLFDEIPEPDVVSWNVVIDDLAQCGHLDEVLSAFDEMRYGVEPNSVTLLGLLSACTKSGELLLGKMIHLYIVMNEVHVSENLGNGLLNMYVKFGDMDSAEKLFVRMNAKTVFSWTSIIDGYIQKGDLNRANLLFYQMPQKDALAWNVMLNGFIAGNDLTAAEDFFEEMPEKDVVSWNCMIVKYAQNNNCARSLELFREMLLSGILPDRITIVSLFSLCGFAGALNLGEAIHSFVEKQNITGEEVDIALIDMYSKCGDPEKAIKSFDGMLTKSVLAWSAMIAGLAINGLANKALEFFSRMQNAGIQPNAVTFIGVLSACSYAGLVEEGKRVFSAMSEIYDIIPRSEHFGCMVDVLARAGLLKEAEHFIHNLPDKADAGVWGPLLGGCILHNDVQKGEKVAKILIELNPSHSGQYVHLSNLYAADNRWFDADIVRKNMKIHGVQKTPGYSLIEQRVPQVLVRPTALVQS